MARTDYIKQLATNYSALQGQDANPAVFDAEFHSAANSILPAIAAKLDIGDTAVQIMAGELDVQAGGVTVQASATGSQARRASEIDSSLALKANLASPTFTGTVVVPVAAGTTSPTQKTYVDALAATKAPLASPAFTGTPTKSGVALATTTDVANAVAAQHTRTWAAGAATGTNSSGGDAEIMITYVASGVTSSASLVVGGVSLWGTMQIAGTGEFVCQVTVPDGQAWSVSGSNSPTITVRILS